MQFNKYTFRITLSHHVFRNVNPNVIDFDHAWIWQIMQASLTVQLHCKQKMACYTDENVAENTDYIRDHWNEVNGKFLYVFFNKSLFIELNKR